MIYSPAIHRAAEKQKKKQDRRWFWHEADGRHFEQQMAAQARASQSVVQIQRSPRSPKSPNPEVTKVTWSLGATARGGDAATDKILQPIFDTP